MTPAPLRTLLRAELREARRLLGGVLLAVAAGIAALVAVSGFAERLERVFTERSATLLGGAVRVDAERDLEPLLADLPPRLRPDVRTRVLPTMAAAGEQLRLVELKAVSAGWPLYGRLELRGDASGGDPVAGAVPARGSVHVEPLLLEQLQIGVGGALEIGGRQLRIAGVIEHEPDRMAGRFSLGPRVLMALDDLPATGLIGPGSRFHSRWLYRLPPGADAEVAAALRARLPDWADVREAADGLEQTRRISGQALDYLRLVALAGLVLAGAALALATQGLVEQRRRSVAVLRTLGASRRLALLAYGALVACVVGAAAVAGLLLGALLELALPYLLAGLVPERLPSSGGAGLRTGALASLLLMLGGAGPALWQLAGTPPLVVLRPGLGGAPPARGARLVAVSAALLAPAALLLWVAEDVRIAAGGFAVLCGGAALLLLGARGLQRLAPRLLARGGFALCFGVLGVARGGARSLLAVAAIGFSVLALLAPLLLQADLVEQWRLKVPPQAPNRFLIDVQPHQRAEVEQLLAQGGATQVWLRPMVRTRLLAINGADPLAGAGLDDSARRLLEREQNLTWIEQPPEPGNRLLAGQWWQGRPATPEASVEVDYAERLGIELGDRLRFGSAGLGVEVTVTSLREVSWESLRSNFFVVLSPGAVDDWPATWITSYRVDADEAGALRRTLVERFPNLSVLDLDAMVDAVQAVVGQASRAALLLSGLTLAAGLGVLLALVVAERGAITREAALLRALGASGRQVRGLYAARFALIGVLAALLGIGGALAAGSLASLWLLDLAYRPAPHWLLATLLATLALVLGVGLLGARPALRAPPLEVLRRPG